MEELRWYKRYAEAIVTGLIVCVVWVGIERMGHTASPWLTPIRDATEAAALVLVACVAVLLLKRIPRRPVIPTTKNIERCVRTWLDNYKIAVQNDPTPTAYFRLQITLMGGQRITVARFRQEYSEYVQVFCDLGVRGENKKLLEQFSEHELEMILLNLKTELARAKFGYGGLINPPEDFHLFKRIPIHPNLNEFVFMAMVGELEAAMNLVLLEFMRAKLSVDHKETQPLTLPE